MTSTPQGADKCQCELRDRQWNPFSKKCERCRLPFDDPFAAPVPPEPSRPVGEPRLIEIDIDGVRQDLELRLVEWEWWDEDAHLEKDEHGNLELTHAFFEKISEVAMSGIEDTYFDKEQLSTQPTPAIAGEPEGGEGEKCGNCGCWIGRHDPDSGSCDTCPTCHGFAPAPAEGGSLNFYKDRGNGHGTCYCGFPRDAHLKVSQDLICPESESLESDKLFNHLVDEHNLTLLSSELQEIERIVLAERNVVTAEGAVVNRDKEWHSAICKNPGVAATPSAVSQYINERDIVILNNYTERINKLNARSLPADAGKTQPVDLLLFCPNCGERHVDEAKPSVCEDCGLTQAEHLRSDRANVKSCSSFNPWLNPPHKSHRCGNCNYVWRPADVPTNGVRDIGTKGANDQSAVPSLTAQLEAQAQTIAKCEAMLMDVDSFPAFYIGNSTYRIYVDKNEKWSLFRIGDGDFYRTFTSPREAYEAACAEQNTALVPDTEDSPDEKENEGE